MLEVGKTRFAEAVGVMGPPDRIVIGWDDAGRAFLQADYYFGKRRASDLALSVPREEIILYNTGVRFLLIFFDALRGKSVVPEEAQGLLPGSGITEAAHPNALRLSDRGGSHPELRGRAIRLNAIRAGQQLDAIGPQGPILPLDPVALGDAARGVDFVRLEFDRTGLLVLKADRRTTPSTSLGSHVRDSLLQ